MNFRSSLLDQVVDSSDDSDDDEIYVAAAHIVTCVVALLRDIGY